MKATTGTFSLDHERAESPRYFVALAGKTLQTSDRVVPDILIAANELTNASGRQYLEDMIDAGKRVLIDSGIFFITNLHARAHRITMDRALMLAPAEIDGFEELWSTYGEIVRTYGDVIWGAIELDQGGAANKRVTRRRIEDELGIVAMPVYHPLLDGWDYLEEIAEGYDRLCYGNVVQAMAFERQRLLHTLFERQRERFPDVWVHVLGLTLSETYFMAPWLGSCDSSSWNRTVRWSGNSHTLARRMGDLRLGVRPAYDAEMTDPNGYWRSTDLCAVQDGWFLPHLARTYARRREALVAR